jgi:hypothetical protein
MYDYPNMEMLQRRKKLLSLELTWTVCCLRLIELGLKPIVVERGKDVRGRRRLEGNQCRSCCK